jgi:hypothetical protein
MKEEPKNRKRKAGGGGMRKKMKTGVVPQAKECLPTRPRVEAPVQKKKKGTCMCEGNLSNLVKEFKGNRTSCCM